MRQRQIAWMTSLVLSACEPGDGIGPGVLEVRLDSSQARARGASLYAEHCVLCHGPRGDGRGVRRDSLSRRPADFRNPVWREGRSADDVFRAIRDGVPGTDMPAWHQLDDEQVLDLVAHVLSLGGGR
jgi:mono/diheme cytochrome c family protein